MTRPLAKSIINFLLRRVIVRTTTIKYAQFDARPKFYVVVLRSDGSVRVCVCYASDSVGWVCSQKREGRKVLLWEVKRAISARSERRSGDKKSDRLVSIVKIILRR